MENIDSLNYALQISNSKALKDIVSTLAAMKTPEYYKWILPGISFVAVIISAVVSIQLFKRNRKLELEKIKISKETQQEIRKEDDQKEFIKACGILYGELSGINYDLQIATLNLNLSNLDYTFHTAIEMSRESNDNAEQLREENRGLSEKHEKKIIEFNSIFKSFIAKVEEYRFLNKSTSVMAHLDKLQKTGFKPRYSRSFANITSSELMDVRISREKEIQDFVYKDLGYITNDILQCLYNMN